MHKAPRKGWGCLIAVLVVLGLPVALIGLLAIGSSSTRSSGGGAATTVAPQVGQPFRADDWEITVLGITDPYSPTNEFDRPSAGQRYVGADVRIKNLTGESRTWVSLLQGVELVDDAGRVYNQTLVADGSPDLDGTVPANGQLRGWAFFEIPDGSAVQALRFRGSPIGDVVDVAVAPTTAPTSATAPTPTSVTATDATPPAPPPSTEPTTTVVPQVGQPFRVDDWEITVLGVTDPYAPANELFGPDAGLRYVGADVSLTNLTSESRAWSLLRVELVDDEGRVYSQAIMVDGSPELDGAVPPDGQRRGWAFFEIPEGSGVQALRFRGSPRGDVVDVVVGPPATAAPPGG